MLVEVSDTTEIDRAAKFAKKKERMLCYRCGDKGHFIAECVAVLCDTCGKPAHESGACPLIREKTPSLMTYGVFCAELTFFESPSEREVPQEVHSMTTGVVKVTRGQVSEAQIIQRLRELAPGDFHWELVRLENNLFRVQFPTVEDLQRLLSFGMCKVPGTKAILEFQEWKLVEPQGKPLTQAWLRFSGAPSALLQDARVVASLGIMVGKTERVDMAFTRAHGIARLLVSILDIDFVPDVVKWAFRGHVYSLEIEFEDDSLFADAPAATGDDMSEGDDDTTGKEPPGNEPRSELAKRPDATDKTAEGGSASNASVPSTTLRFGSFGPASAPPRLWSERVESFEEFEHSLPALDFEDAGVEGSGVTATLESVVLPLSICGGVAEMQEGGPHPSEGSELGVLATPSPTLPEIGRAHV